MPEQARRAVALRFRRCRLRRGRAYPFRYFRRYPSEPVTETPNARSGDAPRPLPYVFHRRRAPSYAPKEVSIYIATSRRHVAVPFF